MRILARNTHSALVQADESDTKSDFVMVFHISIRGPRDLVIDDFEMSPSPIGDHYTRAQVIALSARAAVFLQDEIDGGRPLLN